MELTKDQLESLIAKAIETAVRVAKEPTEEEQMKKLQEEEERDRRRKEAVELARVEEESKKAAWASCSHTKPNGQRSVSGQIHSDGLVHPICLRCQFPFPPFKPSAEQITSGIIFQ